MISIFDARISLREPLGSWKNLFIALCATLIVCLLTVQLNYLFLASTVLANNLSISVFAHIADTLILAALIFAVFLGTSRYLFSVTVILGCYCAFIAASYKKILIFEAPLFPQDVSLITDLILAKGSFYEILPYAVIALVAFVTISSVAWKKSSKAVSPLKKRYSAAIGLLLIYSSFFAALSIEARVINESRDRYLTVKDWFPLFSATSSGLLFEFLIEVSQLEDYDQPSKYRQTEVATIIRRHALHKPAVQNVVKKGGQPEANEPINLIIYLVEAFIDPQIINVQTTRDAIPNFRRLMGTSSSGMATSPVVGGGSANAEFEILTGMSMRLINKGVTPYRHSLKRSTNSLATELHKHGYRSTAMHVSSLGYYNYREAYQNLGFDEWTSLWKQTGVEMDLSGRAPSDKALVADIIKKSQQHKPYFIFAFANSTHHPWNYPGYESSSLDIVGDYSESQRRALKTYVNALNTADKAIESLIRHFSTVKEKTVILILGDHLPALHKIQGPNNIFTPEGLTWRERAEALHQLNAVIWTNYGADKKDFDLGFNFLSTRLLEEMQITPSGFLSVNDTLRKKTTGFSAMIRNSSEEQPFSPPKKYWALKKDYAMLQYDWLFGKQFQKQLEYNPEAAPDLQ